MYSNEKNIIFCRKYCVGHCNSRLIDIIKTKLDKNFPEYQIGFIDYKNFTLFHNEGSRSFHFPALECAGKFPSVALLGITKGSTQLEKALNLFSDNIYSTNNLRTTELAKRFNSSSVYAVFAGRQIRRNMSKIFEKIGLWHILKIKFNFDSPEKNLDFVIGDKVNPTHDSFYIASFIKCALLTKNGKSDAPSFREIIKLEGAAKCIENNLLPPFHYYNKMKIVIVFGKTSFDLVNKFKFNGKSILKHFKDLEVTPIFLPHPSGANISNIQKYLNDELKLSWVTEPCIAKDILIKKLNI